MLFGGRAVNPGAPRNGPTHPKKGVREGRGATKKSERANNTGQVRGACQTGRQRESCRCAGTQTKKKRRPECPKRVVGGRFADCLHRERERRQILKSERCQTHGGGAREGDLIESAWRSIGTAQQHPRLPLKVQRQRAKKVVWRGLVLEIQKRPTHSFFRPIDTSA